MENQKITFRNGEIEVFDEVGIPTHLFSDIFLKKIDKITVYKYNYNTIINIFNIYTNNI